MVKMGRHGENIRRRKDGRWEARYIEGHNEAGRARYRYFYGKTYLEAKKKRKLAMEECCQKTEASDKLSASPTIEQLARQWLAEKRGTVKESTYASYVAIVEKHLLPELGSLCAAFLTTQKLDQFLKDKRKEGRMDGKGSLSPKTVSDVCSVVKMIIRYAQAKGIPVAAKINLPAGASRTPKVKVLTRKDQARLESVLLSEASPLNLGILIALYAGLRIGEVCGLQWGDFHFETGTVRVHKTVIRIPDLDENAPAKTKLLIEKPKTACSDREIPLPDFILRYYLDNRRGDEIYLLTGTTQFMEPRVCLSKYQRVLKQAGIGHYNFHSLRHTFATRCVENDFDIKSLSEIMGHANVNITMQRYVHPSMELKREQMNKLSPIQIHG